MQYIGSLEAAEKHISAKIFKENLHTSVKILRICMDLQDSVQRSLQNPEEQILHICTDSQRSKTWVITSLRFIRKVTLVIPKTTLMCQCGFFDIEETSDFLDATLWSQTFTIVASNVLT